MRFGWRGALGILLSVGFLTWALHDVPWQRVWETLRASNVPLFLASCATATAIFPLRARRWRTILDPIEEFWTTQGQPEQYASGTWGPAGADEMMARDGRTWRLEAYFADAPDEAMIRDLIRPVVGAQADVASFETIDQRDWVRASLEGLKPVRAGRFLVHGSHDRDTVRVNDLAIEIEAALAFGTGHHGTTTGCLEAYDALLSAGRDFPKVLDVGCGTGVLAIAAAWGYTGGSRPYGYLGLGEVGVFLFFGLMATLGTLWTQSGSLPWTAWAGAAGVGLIACALLIVNNIRDIPTDSQVGKTTLAVLLGDRLNERRDELRATLPIGRVVEPADVAALAVHIMANTALTGATFDIDGGQQFVS